MLVKSASWQGSEKLISLTVEKVQTYLAASNWGISDQSPFKVFSKKNQKLVLPEKKGFADFTPQLILLINKLADIESRYPAEIIEDIYNISFDVSRFRFKGSQFSEGTAPLIAGEKMIRGVIGSFQATARTVSKWKKEKKPKVIKSHYTGKFADEASKFLATLKLGQTEIGSYVVNVLTPIPTPKQEPSDSLIESIPFPRLVTESLVQTVQALHEAAEKFILNENEIVFEEARRKGVSANLCDAVLEMAEGVSSYTSLEVDLKRTKKLPWSNETLSTTEIRHEYYAAIHEASSFYKRSTLPKAAELNGLVTNLHREGDSPQGTVTVKSNIDNTERVVQVTLNEEDYNRAVDAHKKVRKVVISGELDLSGNVAKLLNPKMPEELKLEEAENKKSD